MIDNERESFSAEEGLVSSPKELPESEAGSKVVDGRPSDSKAGIFVRISPKSKEILEGAARGPGAATTYGGVIERLLEYYGAQGRDLQEKILSGTAGDPISRYENLLARLHRAQHAFETKRFYFAVKAYQAVAGTLGIDSSDELMDVCNYRLGHSWIRLAYDLRYEALSYDLRQDQLRTKYTELYFLALEALNTALTYLGKPRDGRDPFEDLIKHYNIACCHSLKAQYMVESKLPKKGERDFNSSFREAKKDTDVHEKLWFESIGLIWRELDSEDRGADHEADQALRELEKMYSWPGHSPDASASGQGSESIWIVEMAKDDSDFLFLRSAEGWKDKFDSWVKDALPEDKSIAKPIRDLLKIQ